MSAVDKNTAMLALLRSCPVVQSNPLFFNFGNAQAGTHQLISNPDDKALQKPFIDGSVYKRYTCFIDCFKSVAYTPIATRSGAVLPDENIGDYKEAQDILDWIDEQGEARNFPNFGNDCIIDEMKCTSSKPQLAGVDTTTNPPIAVYRIPIQVDYTDNSKRLWN